MRPRGIFPDRSNSTAARPPRSASRRSMSVSTAKRPRMATCRAGWKEPGKMRRSTKFLTGTAVALGLSVVAVFAPQASAQGQGVFTQEQANAGHSAYALSCGGCHRANLAGGGDAPALGGNGFITSFGNKSTRDLYNFIASSMPAGAPGSLTEDQYTNITAYLLWANGAKPGATALSKSAEVKIFSAADGKVIAEAIAQPSMGKMDAMQARADEFAPPVGHGLDVTGTVK